MSALNAARCDYGAPAETELLLYFFHIFFFFLLSSTNLRSHWPRRGPNPNNSNFSFCPTHFILSRKMTASMSFSTRPTMWEIPREICVKSENANWPMCELCTQSNTQMRTQNLDALQMPIMIGWMHMHHDHRIRVNKWSHLSPIAPGEKKKTWKKPCDAFAIHEIAPAIPSAII